MISCYAPFFMTSSHSKIKILITDDHQVLRQGLINLLHCDDNLQVIGEASNGVEALKFLSEYSVDVVFLDIEMPVMNGRETLINIKKKYSSVKVIMFTTHGELGLSDFYLNSGADAYLVKNSSFEKICDTILHVLSDNNHKKINDTALIKISDEHLQLALTEIELKVLKLICDNNNGDSICKNLGISSNTLKYYRKSIYSKTRTNSLSELIIYAIKQGVINIK